MEKNLNPIQINEGKAKFSAKVLFRSNVFTLLIVMIFVLMVFSFLNKNYFTGDNAINILTAASIVGLLAIGQTYLIIAGHIDLSSGSAAAFAGVFAAIFVKSGMPWPLAMMIVVAVCLGVGLLNSLLVNIFDLQPFIATLATASVFEGLGYIICDGRPVGISDESFIFMGAGKVFGIPIPVIILIALFILFGFILAKTTFGRSVYMIGGNATAARLAGLRPKKISTVLYLLSSGISAAAGIILAARMHSGAPSAVHGSEFDAITATVLGGVAFTGGTGTMAGCFIGLVIIQCFNNGLTVVGVSSFWQIVAKGLLLIGALILDYFRRTKFDKA
jgi:ribose transport system permease protein